MAIIGAVIFGKNVKDINTCYSVEFKENGFAFDFAEITPFFIKTLKKDKIMVEVR
jgi:hypothetical protein